MQSQHSTSRVRQLTELPRGIFLKPKSTIFNISHVETRNTPDTDVLKWPYMSWPISQKRLKETKRHLQGIKYGSS